MPESQRRPVPRVDDGELSTALAFLDFQRQSVLIKCEGLDDDQLRTALVPTGTNLLGLVAHLTVGERYWFSHVLAGNEPDREWDFEEQPPEGVGADEVLEAYRREYARSNDVIRGIGDPDALTAVPVSGEPRTMRWVLTHMTTEIARHAGHADILREQLDGTTGR
jgi:uncharacterized damage-inducible protein DinB